MPEIWLGYGTTNVVLDIKQENLNQIIQSPKILSDENLNDFLSNIKFSKKTLIFPLSSSKFVIKVMSLIIEFFNSKPEFDLSIGTYPMIFHLIKNFFPESVNFLFQVEPQNLLNLIKQYDQVVFISRLLYDPIFGFSGTPSILIRNSSSNLMHQILSSFDKFPQPGSINEPLKIAMEWCNKLDVYSIDLISCASGIIDINYRNAASFKESLSNLNSISTFNVGENKSIIVSSGYEYENHMTLTNSLNFLWNVIPVLKKHGSAVLLSENNKGIGEGALKMYIEGRLDINEIKKKNYINGAEHLLFLDFLKNHYNLGIVSSLPFYYTHKKLGFVTFNNIKEVLVKFMSIYGKNHKILVCPEPDITLLHK